MAESVRAALTLVARGEAALAPDELSHRNLPS
jgi:hypothetical protein